jgi:hypothetical protein
MTQHQNAGADGHAANYSADAPDPMVEATAVQIPQVEYVELRSPATLPGGYELTVEADGDELLVLVVSRTLDLSV